MDAVKCFMLKPDGRRPEKVGTRPRLPQAAIHCPPITEGNELGWLVYPGVGGIWEVERRAEMMRITHEPDETSSFKYPFALEAYENGARQWQAMPPPDVEISMDEYDDGRFAMDDLFHDIHNPAGAVTVTGNCWFQTPPGWDSVWMGITNLFDPPQPQAYTVRVQTDWYAGSPAVEVRYQLRIGEKLKFDSKTPIGMVVFVPREQPALEFLTYTPELKREKEQQIVAKLAPEHFRDGNVLSPFSVWYLRNKKP